MLTIYLENYQDIKIMHIIVNKHLLNDNFSELYKKFRGIILL